MKVQSRFFPEHKALHASRVAAWMERCKTGRVAYLSYLHIIWEEGYGRRGHQMRVRRSRRGSHGYNNSSMSVALEDQHGCTWCLDTVHGSRSCLPRHIASLNAFPFCSRGGRSRDGGNQGAGHQQQQQSRLHRCRALDMRVDDDLGDKESRVATCKGAQWLYR